MSEHVTVKRWRRCLVALLVAVGLSLGGVAGATPVLTGSWRLTDSMHTPRGGFYTATLLPSGAVLVAGGLTTTNPADASHATTATSELYKPGTKHWEQGASMGQARRRHSATLLQNGKVLVVGGDVDFAQGIGPAFASSELYDPSADSWSPRASMSTQRTCHTATLLQDGKVLVAGGEDFTVGIKASAELYDPQTNTWSSAGMMGAARCNHTATLLKNGKVLVAGSGLNPGGPSAELYDPATNSWAPTGSMHQDRTQHAAVRLEDGNVLVTGGLGLPTNETLASSEIYDPDTNSWSIAASMSTTRRFPLLVRLHGGDVLAAGGDSGPNLVVVSSAEVYRPGPDMWVPARSMHSPRLLATATLLRNGEVLVAGGSNADFKVIATSELFRR